MGTDRRWSESTLVTLAYGTLLVGATVVWHLGIEAPRVRSVTGPVAALLLDGSLAALVVVSAARLAGSSLGESERRTVVLSGFGGSVAFTSAVGATIVVRTTEGRGVSEVPFVVFTTLATGFLVGAVAGLFRAKADQETRRLRRTRDAVAFVNGMLRHDVRNDANVIAGYARRLDDDEEAGTVLRERAETVIERTEQARAVTETVTGTADPDPVDLVTMVETAAGSADRTYTRATVGTDLPDELFVRANEALRPALDNLLENAVEHNDREEPRVEVAAERVGEVARLRIADDGPGIPDAEKPTLFDHDGPGTAKGLHVVDTIVDGLGGTVRVEDNEPRGAVFVVDLPAADDPTAATSAADDPFATEAA